MVDHKEEATESTPASIIPPRYAQSTRMDKENVVADSLPPLLASEPPGFYSPNSNPFASRPATRTPAGTAVLRRRSNLGLPPTTPADPLRTSNTMLPPRPEQHLTRSLSGGAPNSGPLSGPRTKPPSPIMPPNLDAVSMAESSDAADWLSSPEITCFGSLHKTWNDIGTFVKDVPMCTPAPANAEGSGETAGGAASQQLGKSSAARQHTPIAQPTQGQPGLQDAISAARPPRLAILDMHVPTPAGHAVARQDTPAEQPESAARSTSWDARWGTSTTPYETLPARPNEEDQAPGEPTRHEEHTREEEGSCLSATGTAVLQWADEAAAPSEDMSAAHTPTSALPSAQHTTASAAALELRRRVAIGGTARLRAAAAGTPRASVGDALAAAVRGVPAVHPPAPSPAPSPLPTGLAGLLAQVNPDSPLIEGRVLPLDGGTPVSRLRVEGVPHRLQQQQEHDATPISRLRVDNPGMGMHEEQYHVQPLPLVVHDSSAGLPTCAAAAASPTAESASAAACPTCAAAASPTAESVPGASPNSGASPSTPSVSVRTPPEAVFATGLCGGARRINDDDEVFACTTSPRMARWRRASEALARRASHYRPLLVSIALQALVHGLLTAAVVVLYAPMWPGAADVAAITGACIPGRRSSPFPYVVPPTIVLRPRTAPVLGLPAPSSALPVPPPQQCKTLLVGGIVGVAALALWAMVLRAVLATRGATDGAEEEQGGGFVTPAATRVVYATPRTSKRVTNAAPPGGEAMGRRRAATSVRRSTRRRTLDD